MLLARTRKMTFFNRALSLLIIYTFVFSNIAFAIPQQDKSAAAKPDEVVIDPEKVVIPREFGLVKTKFSGDNKKLIIHIQDAHCNYEAQSNIAKILENLIKNDGLKFVSVEGADGMIDTSWFKAFPDEQVRKEVADYFMKKGEITGPEFLSITTDYPFKLFGAETRSYYVQNLNAFTSSYPLKDDTEKYYGQIKTVLNRLKTYIYSDELKSLDTTMQDYETKKVQFNDYARFLQALTEKHKINIRSYDNFFKLISVLIYEKKIDFNVVDKERAALIDEVSKKLPKDALTELVTKSLSFKTGKISSAEFYDYLKNIALKNGVELVKRFPNLSNYIIYNAVYSRIENEKLFNDIKKIEMAIKEKLFQNDDQRTLEKLSRHVDIILGLVNIKLLNDDFEYYKTRKEEFAPQVFMDFIGKKTTQYGFSYDIATPPPAIVENVTKLEDFYAIAIKRDKALVDNTINAMDKEKVQVAVLVTGGFHSEGIVKLLENEKVSYMVVCPSITKDVPSPYIQVLTNQRTPFEDILTDRSAATPEKNLLAPQLISDLLLKKRQGVIGTPEGDRVKAFEAGWVNRYVAEWLDEVRRDPQSYGLDESYLGPAAEDKLKRVLEESVEVAVIRADRDKKHFVIGKEEKDYIIKLIGLAFDSHTMKTPFTKGLGTREVFSFDDLIKDLAAKGRIEEIGLKQQGATPLGDVLAQGHDPAGETHIGNLLNAIRDEQVILKVCDLGTEAGFARALKLVDRYTYIYSREEGGKLVIYMPKAFAQPEGLPTERKLNDGMAHVLAQGITEEYLEWSKGGHMKHSEAQDYLRKGYLWSDSAKDAGVSDRDLYIYEHAARDGDREYFRMVLAAYDAARDQAEHGGKLKGVINSSIRLLLELHYTNAELVNLSTDMTLPKDIQDQARNIVNTVSESPEKIADRLEGALNVFFRKNEKVIMGLLSRMLEEYVDKIDKGSMRPNDLKDALKLFLSRYPVLSQGWMAKAIDNMSSLYKKELAKNMIVSVIEETRKTKKVVRMLPIGPRGTRYGQSTTGPFGCEKPFTPTIRTETATAQPKSFLQCSTERALAGGQEPGNVFAVTAQSILQKVQNTLRPYGIPDGNVFGEAQGANTAAVMGIAAVLVGEEFGYDTVISAMTTDHDIPDLDELAKAFDRIETQVALEPIIGILGIDPRGRVDTSMGHVISEQSPILGTDAVFGKSTPNYHVQSFKEKPAPREAAELTEAGATWNSGKFIYRCDTVLERGFKVFQPKYYAWLMEIRDAIRKAKDKKENEGKSIVEITDLPEVQKIITAAYKEFATAEWGKKPFEKAIMENAARAGNRTITVSLTPYRGNWTDLGNSLSRYVGEAEDASGNVARVPVSSNVEAVDMRDSNIEIEPADRDTKIHVYGMENCVVLYDDRSNKAFIVPRKDDQGRLNDFVLGYLYETQDRTPNLKKYVYIDSPNPHGLQRATPAAMPKDKRGNIAILGNEGDILILDTDSEYFPALKEKEHKEFCNNHGVTVYSEGGLTAVAGLRDVTVIRKGREIFVYGPAYQREALELLGQLSPDAAKAKKRLEQVNGLIEQDALTLSDAERFAKEAREEFWKNFDSMNAFMRYNAEVLISLSFHKDRKIAEMATQTFMELARELKDLHTDVSAKVNNLMGIAAIQAVRQKDEDINQALNDFGLMDEKALFARLRTISAPAKFDMSKRGEKIKKIIILTRSRPGGEIAINTIFKEAMRKLFPNADIVVVLVGPKKHEKFFVSGDNDKVVEPRKGPAGTLAEIVKGWSSTREVVDQELRGLGPDECIIIDPFSRLSFFSTLPMFKGDAESGSYLYFNMVSYVTNGRTLSYGETIARFLENIFDKPMEGVFTNASLPVEDKNEANVIFDRFGFKDRHVVAMSNGCSDDWTKAMSIDFEIRVIKELVAKGLPVVFDRGFLPSELARADQIKEALEVSGITTAVVKKAAIATLPEGSEAQVVFYEGPINGFGAIIKRAQQYIGYDSSFQHMAGAVGTPITIVFTGYDSDEFPFMWTTYCRNYKNTITLRDEEKAAREEEIFKRVLASVEAYRNLGPLEGALRSTLPVAERAASGSMTMSAAVQEAAVAQYITPELADHILPFARIVAQRSDRSVYGVNDKVLATALRIMQMAALKTGLVENNMENNLVMRAWGGEGNAMHRGLTHDARNPIAEVWENNTQPTSDRRLYSTVPGTALAVGSEQVAELTLRELVEANPEMLGEGLVRKPMLVKTLSTRFAPRVYDGFNTRINEEGAWEKFEKALEFDRAVMRELKENFKSGLTEEEFNLFKSQYEAWCNAQSAEDWKNPRIAVPEEMANSMRVGYDIRAALERARKSREEIVNYLNVIELKPGQRILSPVGYPHGIFGLSLQTHPPADHPNAKNEGWIVISAGRNAMGEEQLILIEPQQLSGDVTYTLADFYTPFEFKSGKAAMRKDLREGLEAISPAKPATEEEAIKIMVDKGLKKEGFAGTSNFDITGKSRDVTSEYPGAVNAKVESVIEGTYPPVWPEEMFVERVITLEGKGAAEEAKASVKVPVKEYYQEIHVMSGEVTVKVASRAEVRLRKGETALIPKTVSGSSYTVESAGEAAVLVSSVGKDLVKAQEAAKAPKRAGEVPGEERRAPRRPEGPRVEPTATFGEREITKAEFEQEGAFVVEEVAGAFNANFTRYTATPVTVFVQKGMDLASPAVRQRIQRLYGEHPENLHVTEFTSLDDVAQALGSLPAGRRHAVITFQGELDRVRGTQIAVALAQSPILPVATPKEGERLLCKTELLGTGVMAANTTSEDIMQRNNIAVSFLRAVNVFNRNVTWDNLSGLLSADDRGPDFRISALLKELLLSVPASKADIDNLLDAERETRWAA